MVRGNSHVNGNSRPILRPAQSLERLLASKNKKRLPILESRERLARMIKSSWILLVKGAVACGKTTQLPQIALCARAVQRVFLIQHSAYLAANEVYPQLTRELQGVCKVFFVGDPTSPLDDAGILVMSAEQAVRRNLPSELRPTDVVILDEINTWSEYQVCLNSVLIKSLKDCSHQGLSRPFQLTYTSATLLRDFTQWVESQVGVEHVRFLSLCSDFEGVGVVDKETPEGALPFEVYLDKHEEFQKQEMFSLKKFARSCISAAETGHTIIVGFLPGEFEINAIGDALDALIANSETRFTYLKQFEVYRVHGDRPARERAMALEDVSRPKILLCTDILGRGLTPRYFKRVGQADLGVAVIDSQAKYVAEEREGVPSVIMAKTSEEDILQRRGRATKGEACGTYEVVLLRENLPQASTNVLRQGVENAFLHFKRFGIGLESLPVFSCPDFDKQLRTAKKLLVLSGCVTSEDEQITRKGIVISEMGISVQAGVFLLEVIARWPHLQEKALLVAALLRNGYVFDRHFGRRKPVKRSPEEKAAKREKGENGIFYTSALQRLYGECRSDILVQAELLEPTQLTPYLRNALSTDSVRSVKNLMNRFREELSRIESLDKVLRLIRADACPITDVDSDNA